jgi:hypothetical protein
MTSTRVALLGLCALLVCVREAKAEEYDADLEDMEQFDEDESYEYDEQQGGQPQLTPEQQQMVSRRLGLSSSTARTLRLILRCLQQRRFQTELTPYLFEHASETCVAELDKILKMSPEEQQSLPSPPFTEPCQAEIEGHVKAFQPIFLAKLRQEAGLSPEEAGQPEGEGAAPAAPAKEQESAFGTIAAVLAFVGVGIAGIVAWAKQRNDSLAKGKKDSKKDKKKK